MSERNLQEQDVRQMIQDEMAAGATTEGATAPATADPTPVGIAAFALTTFLIGCVLAKWLAQPSWLPMAFFYGGLVQFLAGMWAFRANELFPAIVFGSFGGGFWPGLAFFFFFGERLGLVESGQPVPPALGFFLLGWTVFVLYLTIASAKVNLVVFITFVEFFFTLILLDIGYLLDIPGLVTAGGYAAILLAVLAWYISAAGLINHMFGRVVAPLGGPLGEGS